MRFTNNIEDNNRYFPRGGPGNRGGEGLGLLCCLLSLLAISTW